MDDIVVGIDLGTTYSTIARINDDGRPEAIQNAEGKKTTPSVVMIGDDGIVVGEAALNQWWSDQARVVRWIKRSIGSDRLIHGMSPVQISAEILKALKRDAESALGVPLVEAVITCPAYFNATEVENTKVAGVLAGFNVREIIREPTAAAVYYGVEHMTEGETVMVCDLGGGTFDATILRLAHGRFTPIMTDGDRELGGHDWTMELVGLVAERVRTELGFDPEDDIATGRMLYEACEQAKRDFAQTDAVTIPLPYQGKLTSITVTRHDFEARTAWLIEKMIRRPQRALEDAKLTWNDIQKILLVGGSSRLRSVHEALEKLSGKRPIQISEPDLAVALGAAIMARGEVRPRRLAGGLVEQRGGLITVTYDKPIARSLGTRVIAFDGPRPCITTSIIIPRGTNAPVSLTRKDYAVASDQQEYFDIPVVEVAGSADVATDSAAANAAYELHSNYRVSCRPGARRGDRVAVTFNYDASHIISVEAQDLKSGQNLTATRMPYEEPDLEALGRISLKPLWVVFAIDTSGSMEGEKLANAQAALIQNARQLLSIGGGAIRVGVVSFASTAQTVCDPTSSLAELESQVQQMHASGMTAMDDGIELAVELAMSAPAGATRCVVMLTDGMPDSHRRQRTLDIATQARTRGVELACLGVGKDGVDEDYLSSVTPIWFVIPDAGGIGDGMMTLLMRVTDGQPGGLREALSGGLQEPEG